MSRDQRAELAALFPEGRVRFDEPMSSYSAIAAGGPAEAFVTVEDVGELKRAVGWAVERGVDFRFWGKGSAIIVRDRGVRGMILALGAGFDRAWIERASGEEVFVACHAATAAQDVWRFCAGENLAGLDRLASERGTVGGFLSASSVSEGDEPFPALEEMTILTKDGKELTLRRSALRLEEGRIKIPRTSAIIRALFRLSRAGAVTEVKAAAAAEDMPQLQGVFASPCRSAASELIDDSGLAGVRVGGARVSTGNSNTIVNHGNATVRDIAVLMNLIRDRVREQTGITLVPMIEVIGER